MRRWAKARNWPMPAGKARRRSDVGWRLCRSLLIPATFMRGHSWRVSCAVLVFVGTGAFAQAGDELAVAVTNASEPTLCAETDNVHLKLLSPDVRRFTIE